MQLFHTDTVDDNSRAFGADVVNGCIVQPMNEEIRTQNEFSIEELLQEGNNIPVDYYQFSDWFMEQTAEEDSTLLTTKFNAEDLAGFIYMVCNEMEGGESAINCS